MNEIIIIYALFASISNIQSNCYQKAFEILNGIKDENNNEKNEIEYDSYYSDNYNDTDEIPHQSFQLDINEEILFYNKSQINSNIVFHIEQIGGTNIKSIQKELNFGHGNWT